MNDPNDRLIHALRQGHETRGVDYKAAMAWDTKAGKASCCGVVKDILAMANSGGGLIIFGVDELLDKSFRRSGVPSDMLSSWETTRVNNFVQTYADPPINVLMRRLTDNGLTFIALDVPSFPTVPHICINGYPDVLIRFALYVRTANNASEPIGSSADFHVIIEQAVRNRGNMLMESMRSILVGANLTPTISDDEQFAQQLQEVQERMTDSYPADWPTAFTSFREASWWPARFEATRFPLDALTSVVQKAHIDYHGWPFLWYSPGHFDPVALQDAIECVVLPGRVVSHPFTYWQLRQSGLFYHKEVMPEALDAYNNENSSLSVDIQITTVYVAEAIDCMVRMGDALGLASEEVTLRLCLVNVKGAALQTRRGLLSARYQTALPDVVHESTRSIEDWTAGKVDLAADITHDLMLRFNWASITSAYWGFLHIPPKRCTFPRVMLRPLTTRCAIRAPIRYLRCGCPHAISATNRNERRAVRPVATRRPVLRRTCSPIRGCATRSPSPSRRTGRPGRTPRRPRARRTRPSCSAAHPAGRGTPPP